MISGRSGSRNTRCTTRSERGDASRASSSPRRAHPGFAPPPVGGALLGRPVARRRSQVRDPIGELDGPDGRGPLADASQCSHSLADRDAEGLFDLVRTRCSSSVGAVSSSVSCNNAQRTARSESKSQPGRDHFRRDRGHVNEIRKVGAGNPLRAMALGYNRSAATNRSGSNIRISCHERASCLGSLPVGSPAIVRRID